MTEQHHHHCSKHIIYSVAKRMDKFNSNETKTKQNDVFSLELTKHSFIPTSPNTTLRRHDNHHSPEEELNLGLSLGGQFGVDKSHKGLIRSSSVGGAITLTSGEEALIRTASLPPELQSFGRIEAKRKRLEKQTSVKENGSGDNLNLNMDLDFPGKCNWVHLACGNLQGSSESQGKRSSSGVNFESEKTLEGFGSNGEERTSGSIQSLEEAGSCPGIRTAQVSSKRFNTSDIQKKARVNEKIEDMPCVFTIGDGPKGRKVEGILYRYRKGEEVRIMCVCHGSFFSPAEFVNHAGARDVAHPLKRIVVNPNG